MAFLSRLGKGSTDNDVWETAFFPRGMAHSVVPPSEAASRPVAALGTFRAWAWSLPVWSVRTRSGGCPLVWLSRAQMGKPRPREKRRLTGVTGWLSGGASPTTPHPWHRHQVQEEPRERPFPTGSSAPGRSWARSGTKPSSMVPCCVFLAPEDCDSGAGGEQGRSERPRARGRPQIGRHYLLRPCQPTLASPWWAGHRPSTTHPCRWSSSGGRGRPELQPGATWVPPALRQSLVGQRRADLVHGDSDIEAPPRGRAGQSSDRTDGVRREVLSSRQSV